jgi:hypothetical protein
MGCTNGFGRPVEELVGEGTKTGMEESRKGKTDSSKRTS